MFEMIHHFSMESAILRVVLACLAGTLVGLEREYRNKRAGLKTHALVCMGAAICMVVSEYIGFARPELSTDAARLGANVVTGVGFLGAATIMVGNNNEVKGLTTAAGVWTCACVGLAMGAGYIELALTGVALILFVYGVLGRAGSRIYELSPGFDAYVELDEQSHVHDFLNELRERKIKFTDLRIHHSTSKGVGPSLSFSGTCNHGKEKLSHLRELEALDYVRYFEHS